MGFFWLGCQTVAQWCIDHNINLQQALKWADTSVNPNVLGDRYFVSLSTKAQILAKLGRGNEAIALMKEGVPLGNMNQIHQYGRSLLTQKQNKEAREVFTTNFEKNPNQFTTLMGVVRGYLAMGDI